MREYRSRWGMFTTDLLVRGKLKHIVFTTLRLGGSYFVTGDEDLIKAIENDSAYGKDYYLFDKKDPVKPKKDDNPKGAEETKAPEVLEKVKNEEQSEEEVTISIVEEVTNIAEAREYLKKMGVDYRKLNTPNAISKQALEANIQFPNLK